MPDFITLANCVEGDWEKNIVEREKKELKSIENAYSHLKVKEIAKKYNISTSTYYSRRKKHNLLRNRKVK